MASAGDLDEIVVNGIRRGDLILPTTVTSTSAYGLDLGVMDTPRNNTLLSKTQLDALNIQNPGGFSMLTSSSYADAAFGQPNVPRIRGMLQTLHDVIKGGRVGLVGYFRVLLKSPSYVS